MATISDAESAYLMAQEKFETWKAEFEGDWFAPSAMTMVAMMIGTMRPEERAILQQMNPDAYARVAEMIGKQAKIAGGMNAKRPG